MNLVFDLGVRRPRLAMAAAAAAARSVGALLLSLVTIPLLVQWLGDTRFGALVAAVEWLRQGAVLEIGAALALTPLVNAALTHNNRHALRRGMHAAIRGWGMRALIVLVLGAAVTASITTLVPVGSDLSRELTNACLVGLIGAFLIPLGPFEVLLRAQQRRIALHTLRLLQAAATAGLSLWFARRGFDLPGQFLALLIGSGCFRVGAALAARESLLGFGAVLTEPPDEETAVQLRHVDVPALLARLAARVGRHSEAILVALLLGPRHVVSLVLSRQLVAEATKRIPASILLEPAATTDQPAEGSFDALAALVPARTRSVGGLAVAALVPVFAWNSAFVALWIGGDRFVGDTFTAFACLNGYLLAMVGVWTSVFDAHGRARSLLPAALAAAAVNIAVSVRLMPEAGVIGPLVGTAVATVAVSLWAVPALLTRHFGVSFLRTAGAAALPLLWGIPAAIGLWIWAQLNPPETWVALALDMTTTLAALLLCWWLFALTRGERSERRARIAAGFAGQ